MRRAAREEHPPREEHAPCEEHLLRAEPADRQAPLPPRQRAGHVDVGPGIAGGIDMVGGGEIALTETGGPA